MTRLLKKFRARSLSGDDLDKLFGRGIVVFVAGSLFCFFKIDMEIPARDAHLYGILASTTVAYAIVNLWVFTHAKPDVPIGGGKLVRLLTSLLTGVILSITGGAYVAALNTALGSSEPIFLEAEVIKLHRNYAGFAGIGRHVTVNVNGRPITFSETAERFDQTKLGDIYRTEARLGGLGYYWRSGRNYWK